MRNNLLITSAGRRGVLVKIFQRELKAAIRDAKVLATDAHASLSAACQIADQCFPAPRLDDPGYLSFLIDLCDQHDVGALVPTIDTELLLLAEHKQTLLQAGVHAIVSDLEFVQICRDKRRTQAFFVERGLTPPRQVNPREATEFPIFAKPYDGSSSVDLHLIKSPADLTPRILENPKLIFQEYLDPRGHDEFTVDIYYDRGGQLRCLVPRLRIATRAGEVSKGSTRWLPAFESLKDKLGTIESARGCVTLQVFLHRESGALRGIEINPRFGGGYPLTNDAGGAYAKWVVQEYLMNQTIEAFDGWERNLTMLRYDDHVLVRGADS